MDPTAIRTELETWSETAKTTAETLYRECVCQEKSWWDAWHRLPGPVPCVYYPHTSTNAHFPEVSYPHLPSEEIKQMFLGMEHERKEMDLRARMEAEAARRCEKQTPVEFDRELNELRYEFDMREKAILSREEEIFELEKKLAAMKQAFVDETALFRNCKSRKEKLEATREKILLDVTARRRTAEDTCESTLLLYNTRASETRDRQEKESAYINGLYARLKQAEDDAKRYQGEVDAKRAREAAARWKEEKEREELERRIEEEVRRRKENAEFERLVAMRMG